MRLELDRSALERLLGGDTEAEVSLRNTIVQQFTQRYLKGIAHTQAVALAEAEIKKYIRETAAELFGLQEGVEHAWHIAKGALREQIETEVRSLAASAVKQAMQETLDAHMPLLLAEARRYVRTALAANIEKEIRDGVRDQLTLAAKLVAKESQ